MPVLICHWDLFTYFVKQGKETDRKENTWASSAKYCIKSFQRRWLTFGYSLIISAKHNSLNLLPWFKLFSTSLFITVFIYENVSYKIHAVNIKEYSYPLFRRLLIRFPEIYDVIISVHGYEAIECKTTKSARCISHWNHDYYKYFEAPFTEYRCFIVYRDSSKNSAYTEKIFFVLPIF